jgi:peroxiredoxin
MTKALLKGVLFTAIILLSVLITSSYKVAPKSVIGNSVNDFSLKNTDGKIISLRDYKNAKGFIVIFTCNHCPFAKLYTKRFNDLHDKYSALNVPLLAINSMDTVVYEEEGFLKMQEKSRSENYRFPYLNDAMQTAVKSFKADHTPHAFVIWKEDNQWKIKYSGAIDDNGAEPENVTTPYVVNAVDELLLGKKVTTAETSSIGCAIYYRK